MLASPVAGVFLLLGAAAKLIADGRPALTTALWLALPCLAGGVGLYLLFPEGGTDRFSATAFWPMLVISAAGVALLAPGRRTLWAGGLLYLGVLVAAFAVPSPFGQNALRLGVLAGPSVLALAHRKRVPVLALAVVGVGLLYLQWLPAVRAVAEAHGDPSTRLAFQAEARDFLARVAEPGERVEVPMTVNHWEAADLAKVVPLARGWERQLDQKANPIFYDDEPLTASSYHDWLRENAVRWVALPNAPLDYSARGGGARARARGQVPQARLRVPALADLAGDGHRSARLQRREAARRGAELVHGRRLQDDGRALPLHEVLVAPATRAWRGAKDGWTEVEPRTDGGVILVQAKFGLERGRARKGVLAPVERCGRRS